MNAIPQAMLTIKRLHIRGWDHGSSSVDFRLKPRRRQPTVPTRVTEPRKSMRLSLSYVLWFCTSVGRLILTLRITRMAENAKTGICA